jgi:cbb3-type cytochrome oxidase subunit 3
MEALVEMGRSIVGDNPVGLLLFFLSGISLWGYWQEKKKNEDVAEQRLKEAREDTELYVSTLHEVTDAVREFKATNDTLKVGFDTLARAVTQPKGD